MMGTDMFAEERIAMTERITKLLLELRRGVDQIDNLKKERRELISAKEVMS